MACTSDTPQVPSQNQRWTRPVIQNNTERETKRSDFNNRYGNGLAPETIEAHRTDEFKHFAEGQGSYGGVAYQVANGGIWIFAWKNLLNVNNKAYTKILNPGEEYFWDVIFTNLENHDNNSDNNVNVGLSATVVIDKTSGYPTLTAVLGPAK